MASPLLNLANAVVAVLPSAAIFFWAYGRYDGTFRDNVVFLYFIGGMLMGGFLGFLSLLALELVAAQIVSILLLALIYPIALTVGVNRRKWQGERHAVFNGGAFGLGVAVMMSFTFIFRMYRDVTLASLGQGALVALGFAGLLFGIGLLAGNGVRLRTPFRLAFLGTAILLPAVYFLGILYSTRFWIFGLVLAAYGLVLGALAERKLLIEGVEPEARKQRRRLRRKAPGA